MEVDEIKSVRVEKLNRLKSKGIDPYGSKFPGVEAIAELLSSFTEGRKVIVAGRVVANRKHGKVQFMDLLDQTAKIQLYIKADIVGEEIFSCCEDLDIGDILGVEGELFKTHTGQNSLRVLRFTVLSKSLMTLPEKWHGLKDVEIRYRQRYVDLIANPQVRELFFKRSRIVSFVRSFLDGRGFLEVETPMLQPMAGGAGEDLSKVSIMPTTWKCSCASRRSFI